MATRRMLIDATHREETRVVVVSGNRLEELDVESASRKQLKGNIYLAKVMRVEPSLQAAFVDYGGNRHGFLPFSEIHPDYYQIPVADREALIAAEAVKDEGEDGEGGGKDVEVVGGDDTEDEVAARRRARSVRSYKIQEVIKRRQIILIQVVKEERGNKGAALTTYLSLAGRYCVLMPNTARGGGVSRKIGSSSDRKRLRSILGEMEIPKGMAVIVRTAGSERTKAEIKRDYEYLIRLWESVRQTTLSSSAPCLVYEEANLIKRSIRDLYSRDIDEVVVEGEEGYRVAKDFMKMLTPSHAKKVQSYKDEAMPLFHRYQVESQLDAMHSPTVQLKSGGYIVINPTEALVAIDVNSGRSTRERNIEETAVKTNIEAAEEIARQLRLRDLAGLIVIDFIDMEGSKNQTSVERKLKEAMRSDRARIQIGRISPFGLLELSRQRLRPSLLETSTEPCPYCSGTGVRRSIESTALHVLRAIEEEGIRRRPGRLVVYVPTEVALYILNQKRETLAAIEQRYGLRIALLADDTLIPPDHRLERVKPLPGEVLPEIPAVAAAPAVAEPDEDDDDEEEGETADRESAATTEGEDGGRKRRRRPRRRRRPQDGNGETVVRETGEDAPAASAAINLDAVGDEADETKAAPAEGEEPRESGEGDEGGEGEPRKRRRRGKRGGRRRRRDVTTQAEGETAEEGADGEGEAALAELPAPVAALTDQSQAAPASRRRTRRPKAEDKAEDKTEEKAAEAAPSEPEAEAPPAAKPARRRAKSAAVEAVAADDQASGNETAEKKKPKPRKSAVKKAEGETGAQPEKAETKKAAAKKPAARKTKPKPEADPEAAPEPAAPAPVVSKPVVAVTSDGVVEAVPVEPKRGWWRR